jgi:hypothetical protein
LQETVVVAGSVAQRPGNGGHTWVFLQYLLGFRDLGWSVVFLDRLEPEMCFDEAGRPCRVEESVNLDYLRQVLRQFDLDDSYAVLYDQDRSCLGLTRDRLLERVSESALLLNVNGFVTDEEVLDRAPLRVFLDIDPGFGQMWRELGLHDMFRAHDVYATIGENIGQPDCAIPTCGLDWVRTPQPVVLDHWPARPANGRVFTSVGSWRGPAGPVTYGGRTYGLRVHEFRRFASLPSLSTNPFEVALDIDSSDQKDIDLLRSNGWSLVDPRSVAGDPGGYQRYVQQSGAELMVAKNMYVDTNSGWFSDRSICYLASGKPVLAQDTGFTGRYETGEGLLAFTSLDDAATAVEEVSSDYERHSRAARELAEEHFDSRKVLSRFTSAVGLGEGGGH